METRQSTYRFVIKCAMVNRNPPALRAPAVPRKMSTSSASIFCQMRCAAARFRPWNEIRSMRVRISSALRSGSTVKGSTGTRRKSDFFGMRNPQG